jgi:hypothetical protein
MTIKSYSYNRTIALATELLALRSAIEEYKKRDLYVAIDFNPIYILGLEFELVKLRFWFWYRVNRLVQ